MGEHMSLEYLKCKSLKISNGNYNAKMELSTDSLSDLNWWLDNINRSGCTVIQRCYSYTIFSNASSSDWGAVCSAQETGGFWNKEEAKHHINYLELLASLYSLQSFVQYFTQS